jgi:hypothetical protein
MQIPQLLIAEQAHPHTPESFVRDFRTPQAEVRAWVNWERILEAPVTVQETILYEKADIGEMETVWYQLPDGRRSSWWNQQARRTLVREVPNRPDYPSADSYREVQLFVDWLEETPEDTVVSIPAFRTHDNRFVILDGNHRSSAIYQSPRPVGMRVISIGGVDDPFLVPDMIHTTHGLASPEDWQTMVDALDEAYHMNLKKEN